MTSLRLILSVIVRGIMLFHVPLGELGLVLLHLSAQLYLPQFDEELDHISQVILVVDQALGNFVMSLSVDYVRSSWPATSIRLDPTPRPPEVILKFPDTVLLSLLEVR